MNSYSYLIKKTVGNYLYLAKLIPFNNVSLSNKNNHQSVIVLK